MTVIEEIHVYDIGTVFEATIKDGDNVVDLSSATTKDFVFGKPDGTSFIRPTAFVTDGKDGKIKYASVADDLSAAGNWRLQFSVEMSGGAWKTDIGSFTVYPNV